MSRCARRMGEIGRERVKNVLAWEHEVPRLLAAYDELFTPRSTPDAR